MNRANLPVCRSSERIAALRAAAASSPGPLLNGIQYVEVMPGQRRLAVRFVHSLDVAPATPLSIANVEVRGGTRVRDPRVTSISWVDDVMSVDVATAGDFSRYELRLVAGAASGDPPAGIDPMLSSVGFSFKVDCPSDFDCRPARECPPAREPAPAIDYLARDYATFRRLLLDRMSTVMPGWRERNAADLMMTMVEAAAFRADEIAYFQDAVGTEAYLGTARQRVSIQRHARMLDYPFHDGCNARAWVAFTAGAAGNGLTVPGCASSGIGGTLLLSRTPGLPPTIDAAEVDSAIAAGAQPFELLETVALWEAHDAIAFYTASDVECCLPAGSTGALLLDRDAARLRLRRGDVLIVESAKGTATGETSDADPRQRHAVRLTRVDPEAPVDNGIRGVPAPRVDPVTRLSFVEVEWADSDALPFALCLSKRIGGRLVDRMAVARGNVALADHGLTRTLPTIGVPRPVGRARRYPLDLPGSARLTRQSRMRAADGEGAPVMVDAAAGAAAALDCDIADATPAVELVSLDTGRRWHARRDLLASPPDAADFVVETDDDGKIWLRFGDGTNGLRALDGERFEARVRAGNGSAGNVGAEAIHHVVTPHAGIAVRNPLPATGGRESESAADAKLYAPQAFRRQERAVTVDDYAAVTERDRHVQRAVATRRWTGSWTTIFIAVDRRGSAALDPAFESRIARFVERYRMAGHDVEIESPRFVALDIALHVCARRGYFPEDVERRLLQVFGAGRLPSGDPGFFHADRYTFGQPVYLSEMLAAAMRTPGVAWLTPRRFQRLGRNAAGEIDAGRIAMGRLEIARLDNDPNAPENGRLRIEVDAGA